ncbi:MAG: hydroxymethylglutaryl-CoA synthase [Candidatus Lokiarchaeota archaeon]|nr:hydroxymethylglutaryl-CoA synthase [Candidatus Lokiarchaeota archaeon]
MIKMTLGVVAYQPYIPKFRITSKEIRSVWGLSASGILEKSVPYRDEDSISMAIAATIDLFKNIKMDLGQIQALYFASISSPYIDKPVSTQLVSMLDLNHNVFTTDIGGSSQAGIMALENCRHSLKNGTRGLIIISDCLKTEPHSILERSLGSGAVSLIIGEDNTLADITGSYTYSQEISDRWKGVNNEYKVGDERFAREFGYIPVIKSAISGLMDRYDKNLEDFDHFVLQQPDGKTPKYIAKEMKFDSSKLQRGNVAKFFGDLGSASVFLGLAKVLDEAEPGEEILIAAYSCGGCHTMSFKVNSNVNDFRCNPTVQELIDNKEYINYVDYLKLLKFI